MKIGGITATLQGGGNTRGGDASKMSISSFSFYASLPLLAFPPFMPSSFLPSSLSPFLVYKFSF